MTKEYFILTDSRSHKVMDKEKELESDSRLLYPGFTEGDNRERRADDRDSSVYLFPAR